MRTRDITAHRWTPSLKSFCCCLTKGSFLWVPLMMCPASSALHAAQAPANDNFADAQGIADAAGSVIGTTMLATKEQGEPNHAGNPGGHSVWYRWVAPGSGLTTIDTVGSSFDTLLAIYTNGSVGTLSLVAANDDIAPPGNRASRVTFSAAAGQVYQVAVDGYNGASGSVTLNWRLGAPANDNFANAQLINGAAGSVSGGTAAATKETGEPNHASNPGGHSVWYRWTAPSNGCVTFDTVGTSFDTLLGAYAGASVGALSVLATNDDISPPGNSASRISFSVVTGLVCQVAVDGYNGASGSVTLNWRLEAGPPANDNFAWAQVIRGSSGLVRGSSLCATKEPGEPDHAAEPGGRSVWYQWMAPGNGPATIDTVGSGFDTVLAVYTGSNLRALSLVASNDDLDPSGLNVQSRVMFDAVAGEAYRIAVDGFGGEGGSVRFNWSVSLPSPPNDNFAGAQLISSPSGRATGSNLAATREAAEPPNSGRTVWWSWIAPSDGLYFFSTAGSSFDTILCVFHGASLTNLTSAGCDNDGETNLNSRVEFVGAVGTQYWIRVDGVGAVEGDITLTWGARALPRLLIEQLGLQVRLGWDAASFRLESAPMLLNPSSLTIWTTNSGSSPVTLPASNQMFFRLVLP